jgi:hypothetical protein
MMDAHHLLIAPLPLIVAQFKNQWLKLRLGHLTLIPPHGLAI